MKQFHKTNYDVVQRTSEDPVLVDWKKPSVSAPPTMDPPLLPLEVEGFTHYERKRNVQAVTSSPDHLTE